MGSGQTAYDATVVGGGHNGLVAAACLARAGLTVLVLERLGHLGGAVASTVGFAGHEARIGRYAAFVSVPDQILTDLDLDVTLLPTGDDLRAGRWQRLVDAVAPTLLAPLLSERDVREQVDPDTWRKLVALPSGDPALARHRSALHHRLSAWRVPVGGPAALTEALCRSASAAGAEILTSAGVSQVRGDDDLAEVTWHDDTGSHTVSSRHVLAGVAPWVLRILLGEEEDALSKPRGAHASISLLLDRLPVLRSGADPRQIFAGTLHLAGVGQVRCPSLADPSVLGGDAVAGRHVLSCATTASGGDHEQTTARLLAALDQHLGEPVSSVIATDTEGRPCIDVQLPEDIEAELALPGGHPFHGDLDWPWAANRSRLETPAQQWGVQSGIGSVVVCGAGARRGGVVAGVAGHNAAQAVLAVR